MFPPVKFRLNEFQAIGRWVEDNLPPLFAWTVNAFLYGLESRWIDAKTKATVEAAIARYSALQGPIVPDPVYTVTHSEVEGLDDIRLTAPWMPNNSKRD